MQNTRNNIKFIRDFAPGYIGGKEIVKKATDNEIRYLIGLNNQIAELDGTLLDLRKQEKNIIDCIKKRICLNKHIRQRSSKPLCSS